MNNELLKKLGSNASCSATHFLLFSNNLLYEFSINQVIIYLVKISLFSLILKNEYVS